MDDLAQLADSVTGFATAENLTIVPAVPEQGFGPIVCLGSPELSPSPKALTSGLPGRSPARPATGRRK
jgi:hypothetical protein